MRRRIEALADRFEEFVSEDDHDCLLITCSDDGVGLVGAAVDLTEQRGSIDVSIPFFERFVDASGMIASIQARIATGATAPDASIAALVEAMGGLSAALRVRADVRVVLWLAPTAVEDVAAYIACASQLVDCARSQRPWVRLAFRELPEKALSATLRRRGASLLEVALASDAKAIRDGLAEDALAPDAHPSARAAAALAVAMADAAAGRTDDALRALSTLADHHHAQRDEVARGLCFVLASGLLARTGQLGDARAQASRGLSLALDHASPTLALNAAITSGELALLDGDVREADAEFDLAARIAASLGHYAGIAHALMRRATIFVGSGDLPRARDALACAAVAAARASARDVERDALEQLAGLFRASDMTREADAIAARARMVEPAHTHGVHGR